MYTGAGNTKQAKNGMHCLLRKKDLIFKKEADDIGATGSDKAKQKLAFAGNVLVSEEMAEPLRDDAELLSDAPMATLPIEPAAAPSAEPAAEPAAKVQSPPPARPAPGPVEPGPEAPMVAITPPRASPRISARAAALAEATTPVRMGSLVGHAVPAPPEGVRPGSQQSTPKRAPDADAAPMVVDGEQPPADPSANGGSVTPRISMAARAAAAQDIDGGVMIISRCMGERGGNIPLYLLI